MLFMGESTERRGKHNGEEKTPDHTPSPFVFSFEGPLSRWRGNPAESNGGELPRAKTALFPL
jgi:hypothetical protein